MDKTKILLQQRDRYIYCRDEGHLDFQKKARRCEEFFSGDQWDEKTKQRLAAARRPALTLNKTLPSLMVLFSEQLKNRASVNYVPLQGGTQSTANALNKLWLYTSARNNLKWTESQVFDDAVITGRGFYDLRMNFDKNMMGEVKITHANPLNVIIDPDAEEYDSDTWSDVFYSKWLSIEDIERMYGKKAASSVRNTAQNTVPLGYDHLDIRPDTFGGAEDVRPGLYSQEIQDYRRRVRVLERQYKEKRVQEHFVDIETGDLSLKPDDMPREKVQAIMNEFDVAVIKRPVDVLYWTVTAGDTLLHHEESPYKHFTIVPFFPVFRRGSTLGMVENMIDAQELYNKARSQELHVINTSANSGWIKKQNAVLNMSDEELEERGAESGLVLNVTDVNDIEKITPNPIPTGLDRVSQIAGEDLKEISMASDSMRGFDREDVAAKAIQAKQQVGGKNFAKILDNLAFTRTILAKRTLTLMQTFYTTEREFQITGETYKQQQPQSVNINAPAPEGTPEEEAPAGILNDISVGNYDVVVTNVSDRDTLQQTQLEQAIQLRELGVPIPDNILLQNSTLEAKEEIIEQLTQDPDSPTERMKELEVQIKEIEAQKEMAETEKIKSETALNLVRAGRDAAETELKQGEAMAGPEAAAAPTGPAPPDPMQVQQQVTDAQMKKRELDEQIRQFNEDLGFKRDELSLKRAEAKAKAINENLKLKQASAPAQAAKPKEGKKS